MKDGYNCVVSLDNLRIQVRLGVADEEKDIPQDILVSFKLFFSQTPAACNSDDINETICYNKIACIIESYCLKNEFRLLEYLCFQLHKQVRKTIDNSIKFWIKVEKCSPPVKNIEGTTSFEYSDF